ncbi:transposable element Tc1 transposase [Trichonephila clavipes]|uniref:Transposable element Tc1 transposase n=1 Tax=Trichonephila clavipes TaxID=2585209 RepID=A0A8X6R5C2_TRICX|nr:transposable element Tc1 transposase [Trichonephila clavipes]
MKFLQTDVTHPLKWLATLTTEPLVLGSNPGEDTDVYKCIGPSRHEVTLNSRRASNSLVRLVEEEERWETPDPPGCSPSKTRPRKISLREDRLLLSNRKLNSSQILKQWTLTSNVSVCPRTVRGRLLEIGLRGCKALPKPLLTEFQRKTRLTWAREHSLWTIKYLEKVIVSDESQFCISGNQSSAYVRRRTHEEFSPQCLKPTVKYPT